MSDIPEWIPGADKLASRPANRPEAPSPQTTPSDPPGATRSTTSSETETDWGARLAAVEFVENEPAGEDRGLIDAGEAAEAAAEAEFIGPDEFWQGFAFAFDAAGMATGLATLPIAEPEQPAGRAASDALYRMIRRYPAVARWILGPQSAFMGDLIALGGFAVPKALAVRAELAQRQAAARRPQRPPAADGGEAPDGARPEPAYEGPGEDVVLEARAAA